MPNNFLVEQFLMEAVANPQADLSGYKHPEFANKIRLNAVNSIVSILTLIKHRRSHAYAYANCPNLDSELNKIGYFYNGLTAVDYCILAGFDNLAMEFIINGINPKDFEKFANNVERCFPSQQTNPQIIQDIKSTIEKIRLNQMSRYSLRAEGPPALVEHRFPALLFTIGVTCSALSSLLHNMGSVLLLSIGIPSLLASINSLQSSSTNHDRATLDLTRDRWAYEDRALAKMLEMTISLEAEIKRSILNASIITRDNSEKNLAQSSHKTELLFSHAEAGTEPTGQMNSKLIARSFLLKS